MLIEDKAHLQDIETIKIPMSVLTYSGFWGLPHSKGIKLALQCDLLQPVEHRGSHVRAIALP